MMTSGLAVLTLTAAVQDGTAEDAQFESLYHSVFFSGNFARAESDGSTWDRSTYKKN